MSYSDGTPGLCSARSQKRHAAVSRDMLNIQRRLDELSSFTKAMDFKFDAILEHITGSPAQKSSPLGDVTSEMRDVTERINRMELLLLRTSLEDFRTLDQEIEQLLPKTVPSSEIKKDESSSEPEIEESPNKILKSHTNNEVATAMKFDIFEEKVNMGSQTDGAHHRAKAVDTVDAWSQWCASDVPVGDLALSEATAAIDELGFDDKKLPRSELRTRAQHLLAEGYTIEMINKLMEEQWDLVLSIRPGDTLTRLCGTAWLMVGSNGRTYVSDNKIKVRSISSPGYFEGRSLKNGEFGRVELANYMFSIEET